MYKINKKRKKFINNQSIGSESLLPLGTLHKDNINKFTHKNVRISITIILNSLFL